MTTPLSGVSVVELTTMITAPLAGMMLADLGADVVKVERPEGDPFRQYAGTNYSPHFAAFNRNKRGIVLDLQTADGRAHLHGLLRNADVLLDNYRPGVLERLGLGPETLQELNPGLIHCSVTGFGSRGPYKQRPAFDTVGQALSGISSLAIDPDQPLLTGTTISDNVAGMYAAYAVLGALIERARTGNGVRLEVNMLEASMAFMPDAFLNLGMHNLVNDPYTRIASSLAFVFRCKDERLLALHLSSPEKFWRGLVSVTGRSDLLEDTRFTTRDLRVKHYHALRAILGPVFTERPRGEWMTALEVADVPFAPVQNTKEALDDPQVTALGILRDLDLPWGGTMRAVQAPVLWDGARLEPWSRAPTLGEHTQDITVPESADASREKPP